MQMNGFFVSHYLNRVTDSHQRATVLSFKGLSFNLAYGAIGLLYALLFSTLKASTVKESAGMTGKTLENAVFMESMGWFPGYFFLTLAVLLVFARFRLDVGTAFSTPTATSDTSSAPP
jgi:hypothetical protein